MPGVIKLNPEIFNDERDALAVAWNEALRLWMDDHDYVPEFEVTEEQKQALSETAYPGDEDAMAQTVMARIITQDTSSPNPTPEQLEEAIELLGIIGSELGEGDPDMEGVVLLSQALEQALGQGAGAEEVLPEEELPEEGLPEEELPEEGLPEEGLPEEGLPETDMPQQEGEGMPEEGMPPEGGEGMTEGQEPPDEDARPPADEEAALMAAMAQQGG